MSHSMLQCAFNPIGLHYISRDQPKAHELTNHILHPSPEPFLRSPGAPEKKFAQAVRNGSGVTDRNYWQFTQDIFNGNDVDNWFLVVELV